MAESDRLFTVCAKMINSINVCICLLWQKQVDCDTSAPVALLQASCGATLVYSPCSA